MTKLKLINYNGSIMSETTKPDGPPRRMLDTNRAEREFGFKVATNYEAGLRQTID